MQRFKAWLFVWLMGEHFAEIEREHQALVRQRETDISVLRIELKDLRARIIPAPQPDRSKKVIQSRNWADFQRLAGDSDQEVQ